MIKGIGRTGAIAGVVLAAAIAVPNAAGAQAKLELTPFVGSFYPLANMCTDCNNANDGTNYRGNQLSSVTVGGSLSYWLSRTLGVAAVVGWAPSRISEDTAGVLGIRDGTSIKGNILLANARLLFRPARTNLHFIVGGGIVRRSGEFWKFVKSATNVKLTSPAGVVGVGVRASVTPKFALNISAEGNFYSFDPHFGQGTDPSNGSKLQSDVVISIGIPITLSR